ncbi:hypothetical protein DYBT9623_00956 [Dyadobacter sp. CECT 9623]|uniref:Lipocalin-like domain-containing protein n=1 Tax=Dyadobacter linearis TaxID=2823330 RepID=A0ABM8UL87_9BACT|nr:hypothetical protein [Dyadobacter sp. CECT 9623]CAG5068227.1 hypothetical protein DYBT9623_00956 [Dyadobacter sp. CECT 9623]
MSIIRATSFLKILSIASFPVLLAGCFRRGDEVLPDNSPVSSLVSGTWILEKVVTPTKVLTGSQIGYSEKLVVSSVNGYVADQIYRDDTLFATNFRAGNIKPTQSAKLKTVLMHYRDGRKRFFKVTIVLREPTILQASQYLHELGGQADSIKYYYSQNWW